MIMLEIQIWMQSKLWQFITKASNLEKGIVRSGNPADFPSSATKASVFWSNCFELAFWRFGILAMGSFQFTQWRGKSISCSQQPRLSLNALLGFFSIKDILVGNVPFSVTPHLTVIVPLKFWNICDILPFLGWQKKMISFCYLVISMNIASI